jgi:hypothetical protein
VNEEKKGLPSFNIRVDCIYNQEHYGDDFLNNESYPSWYYRGKPLVLPKGTVIEDTSTPAGIRVDEDIPIGYNIYLPKGDIKGVMVTVYGGHQKNDRQQKMYKPGVPNHLNAYLLSNGIACIQLNLVDLLELNQWQFYMNAELNSKIHASIDAFFRALKLNPSGLHEKLNKLIGKPIFLYGASFGGRTSIRHAQLYPNTFDGYISHDGGLSFDMLLKSDLPIAKRKLTYKDIPKHLHPMNSEMKNLDDQIALITKPILVLHTFDDNNASIKTTLDWYKKVAEMGKQDLVRLFITQNGNPIPDLKEPHNKGHGHPTDETAFTRYANTVLNFILGAPHEPHLSAWQAHRYEQLANKYYRLATPLEQFLSESFWSYKTLNPAGVCFPVESRDVLQQGVEEYVRNNWETAYRPIYYAYQVIDRIKNNPYGEIYDLWSGNHLTDENSQNSLKKLLPPFIQYLEESQKHTGYQKKDMDQLIENRELIETYRSLLTESAIKRVEATSVFMSFYQTAKNWISTHITNPDTSLEHYLLTSFFLENPQLMTKYYPTTESEDEKNAQKELVKIIVQDVTNIKKVWQQSTRAMLKKSRETNL